MDIVERLRREEDRLDDEAADEIERLREENAELLKALTDLFEACKWEKIAPEVDAARFAITKARKEKE